MFCALGVTLKYCYVVPFLDEWLRWSFQGPQTKSVTVDHLNTLFSYSGQHGHDDSDGLLSGHSTDGPSHAKMFKSDRHGSSMW